MRRILSFLTALALVLCMVPAVTFAAEARTVYLDPAAGKDTNSGLTETAPVKTVEAAYDALKGAAQGTVVLLSTLTLTAETTYFPEVSFPVTITGKTGSQGITSSGHIFFGGDTTLEKLTLTLTSGTNTTYLSSEGHDLTIGEGVTCESTSTYRFCITGRYGAGSVDGVTITVKSGLWRNIFPGGYKSATTGNATLIMTGGDSNNLIAPTFSGNISGDTAMYVSGATFTALCAAPNETGVITGNVDITLGDGAAGKVRVKRYTKNATVNGTATVTVDGDCSGLTAMVHEGSGNGTITETRLVLKSGVLALDPCAFDEVAVQIPAGKTLKLQDSVITANTVDSAGTLVFSGDAALTAKAVTGTLSCSISGTPKAGHTYVTAPAGAAVTFPADTQITENNGVWTTPGASDESNFQGLVVRAAKGVSITLYSEYKANTGAKVTPTKTVEEGSQVSYYYEGASGAYRCVASQSGYYKLTKNIYVSAEEAKTCTEQIIVMDQRSGGTATDSWEVSAYQNYTDELLSKEAHNDAISNWPQYADVFTTPLFTENNAAHQQTTQAQVDAFIDKLDDDKDNLYVFSMGKSGGYAHDVWVVFITKTDLSGAKTAEEAAILMGQDKPTVMYRAQIHGNEPAGGEAALAMLQRLDGAYGDRLIEDINIVMVPRANPDGSQNYARTLASGVDANRDMLRLASQEIADYLRIYQLVEPEMVIDGHEYDGSAGSSYFYDSDITAGAGFGESNTEAYKQVSIELLQQVFAGAAQNGLTYRYYSNQLNSDNGNISRPYFGQQGCLSFLLETRGIGTGLENIARRVVTQVICVETLLDYAANNAAAMQQLVDSEKAHIVEKGKTYREDDRVILSVAAVADDNYSLDLKRIYQNGNETTVAVAPGVFNNVLRSRTAPTAYVIPAGATFTQQVLELMDKQGISYTFIPAGSTVRLQQYTGTAEAAGLTAEKSVTFGQGAYVFTLNQVRGITLSMLMEPDVTDLAEHKGTLAQQGIINPVGGDFPIYRYCYDLNADGFINYTKGQAEVLHVTVYLDGTNGLDTNNGLSEATAVKTLEQAYAVLSLALQAAGEGSTGKVVITGMYDLGNEAYAFPGLGFPVTVTGKTADDGIRYAGKSESDPFNRTISLHGDTTFEHLTLFADSAYTHNFIVANGYDLTMGEGVNSICREGKNYQFTLFGGAYYDTETVASTNLVVRSGTWRAIYAGGYNGSVSGTAKLEISNATVYADIHAARMGNVGKAEIHISNITVSTGAIYAGTATANTNKQLGFVQEGVTVTLGENVVAPAMYCSAKTYGSITGGVTLILAGADLTQVPVYGRCADLSDKYSTDWILVRLAADMATPMTLEPSMTLDLNGHNITGSLAVDGTLPVKDSRTDDFTVADGIYGQITGTVTGTLAAAEGYVAIDGTSFHRFEQKISGVSIRPSVAGMYFKATWLCDEVVASRIAAYGVAVSLVDMPDATFDTTDADSLWTAFDKRGFASGQARTSAVIANILGNGEDNDTRGKAPIYAAPYVILEDGTKLVATEEVSYSLCEVMHLVEAYAYEQNAEKLNAFYALWEDTMKNWEFQKIGK